MNALMALAVLVMSAFPAIGWRPLGVDLDANGNPYVGRLTSQILSLSCPCNHIMLEGTRGGGKSEAQLMAFRMRVGLGYGAYWRGVIFDREYKNLDDLIAKSKKIFGKFNDGARFLASKGDYKWVWPTGEELLFRVVKKASDYDDYHGHEYPFIGWNELTKWPTSELYDALMSCNRSSFLPDEHSPVDPDTGERLLLPEIPLIVFSTTNPYGAGHNWVKARFIDVAKPGRIVRTTTEVFNPRTQRRENVTKTQIRFFSSYKENRYLSPEYVAELEGIKDPGRRKAWLFGDWDIPSGGALDDVWSESVVVQRFKVPRSWPVDRTMDWGSTHPCSIGWWAEANGEEIALNDGTKFCPPAGSLVRIAEWYICTEIGRNKGLRLPVKAIADGIKERESALLAQGWVSAEISPGPADNAIGNVIEQSTDSIASMFSAQGIEWAESDKSSGSRSIGLQLIRDRLQAVREGEGPGVYVMSNCAASIELVPHVPRDEVKQDDVDTEAEDHIYDEWRYRVLAGTGKGAAKLKFTFPM